MEAKNYTIRIESLSSLWVAFMRHTGPYKNAGETFQKMMCWAMGKGLFTPNTKVLSVCHDDPEVTPDENNDSIAVFLLMKASYQVTKFRCKKSRVANT